MPLQTAGERALFAELARWDTGGAVRGAVVASIPVVTDGPLQRRLADAVLIVPEGIAVVRIAEVERQSGVVTVKPEGSWTIAPGRGPGEVLQLGGGGSTTLDGLMRAGMDAAVRLRRAGLEPGRIARLTVLVGELSGLEPADGDLGEGDQVAILEPRSLLLGIARASRYAGVDNPRLWTTADVRAALEALGLSGRGPSVEELNGEGFPYSPYVLRRPELLAPAAMTAASTAPPGPAAASPSVPAPAAAPVPGPAPVPAAAPVPVAAAVPAPMAPAAAAVPVPAMTGAPAPAASATATAPAFLPQAAPPAPSADPFAGRPERDTIAVGSAESADDTDGIGGLFASAEPVHPPSPPLPPVPGGGTHTAVMTAPPQWSAPPEVADPEPAGPSRRRGILLAAAVVLVLVLDAIGALLILSAAGHGNRSASGSKVSGATRSAAPASLATGRTQAVDGVTFTLRASRVDTTCVGHSYGQVAGFFADSDCTGLSRALYSAEVGGHPMVAAISHVRMPDAARAQALRALTDTSGTGNVADLLREGVRYDGGPEKLVNSEYSSEQQGDEVTIVETSWVDQADAGSADRLDVEANSGLVLDLQPLPGR
jgi:hypothetical protein